MRAHWTHWLALGFGSGLSPVAPGTVGTLLAWVLFLLLDALLPQAVLATGVLVSIVAGVWLSQRVIDASGIADPRAVVWDEIAAFWLVLLVVGDGLGIQFAAFLLFRLFDAWKPFPIRWLDQNVHGGFGVMLDDLGAALATLFSIALWVHFS